MRRLHYFALLILGCGGSEPLAFDAQPLVPQGALGAAFSALRLEARPGGFAGRVELPIAVDAIVDLRVFRREQTFIGGEPRFERADLGFFGCVARAESAGPGVSAIELSCEDRGIPRRYALHAAELIDVVAIASGEGVPLAARPSVKALLEEQPWGVRADFTIPARAAEVLDLRVVRRDGRRAEDLAGFGCHVSVASGAGPTAQVRVLCRTEDLPPGRSLKPLEHVELCYFARSRVAGVEAVRGVVSVGASARASLAMPVPADRVMDLRALAKRERHGDGEVVVERASLEPQGCRLAVEPDGPSRSIARVDCSDADGAVGEGDAIQLVYFTERRVPSFDLATRVGAELPAARTPKGK